MVSEQSREIWRHASVGGAIAFVLVLFEKIGKVVEPVREWLVDAFSISIKPFVLDLILICVIGVAAFVIAFAAIVWLEGRWRRKDKILIPTLRQPIDGRWIDAIVRNGRIVGASIFKISSTVGEGFSVEGDSFKVRDQTTILFEAKNVKDQHGWFKGEQGSIFAQNGISYTYKGARYDENQNSTPHFGVVYYEFFNDDPTLRGLTCFKGAFLAREENSIYHVFGRRIDNPAEGERADWDVQALASDWINSEPVRQFRNECLGKFHREFEAETKSETFRSPFQRSPKGIFAKIFGC